MILYQALYRKWRPRDFDDVVGQEHITTTLKHEIASGKFSHAYLFTGSRGTGKTSCSKIVAKAVNCLHPRNGNPCNECEICRGIDDGSILDVSEIDAASNNGVDNIRELREEAFFLPAVANYRVYILDECHMLSPGAVNALLKILEEPPEHVIFILATTEIHKVLPTILSRCQRFDFKRIKARTIADRLLYVCEREQAHITDSAALLIARLSDGGMRDALSLLDLCISGGSEITEELVTNVAGLSGQEPLFRLADAALEGNPSEALLILDELSEKSVDYVRLCEQLVSHYRNLMIARTVKEPEDLIQVSSEELDRLIRQAKQSSLERVMFAIDVLQETMGKLSRTAFKRTEFEMALIRLCDARMSAAPEAIVARIETMEKLIRSKAVVPLASAEPVVASAATHPPEQDTAPDVVLRQDAPHAEPGCTSVEPFDRWAEVLTELQKSNGALYGAMIDSCAYTSGDIVLIDCKNELFLTLLRTSMAAKESLRAAILSVTGKKFNLGPYRPEKHVIAEKANDPLVGILKKASELHVPVDLK